MTGAAGRCGGGVVGSSGTSVDWRLDSSWSVSCLEGVWLVLGLSLVFENDEAALLDPGMATLKALLCGPCPLLLVALILKM